MKKLFSVLCGAILLYNGLIAQAPQTIPYQAIARDVNDNPIPSQKISLRFSILNGGSSGTLVYQETQQATTDALGLFNLSVGAGTVTSGTFSSINWGSGTMFLKVEMDPTGNTNYTPMGTSQMESVPYALFSGNSGGSGWGLTGNAGTNPATNFMGTTDANDLVFSTNNKERTRVLNGGNVGIGIPAPSTLLQVGNGGATGKLSVYSADNNTGQVQIGNPNVGEASLGFISNIDSFGSPASSHSGNNFVWDIGAGNWSNPGSTFGIGNAGFGGTMLNVMATGNVGVGIAAPTTLLQVGNGGTPGKLSVYSADYGFGQLQIGNPNSNGIASIGFISGVTSFSGAPSSTNGFSNIWEMGAGVGYTNPGSTFGIGNFQYGLTNQGAAILNLTSSGNVGVGFNAPTTLLQVGSGGASGKLSVYSQDNGTGQLQIGNPTLGAEASIGFISGVTAFGSTPLSGNNTNYNSNIWDIGAGNYGLDGSAFGIGNLNYAQVIGGPIMSINSADGFIGIGTGIAEPSAPLDVEATYITWNNDYNYLANDSAKPIGYYDSGLSNGFNVALSIQAAGVIASTEFIAFSDARIKEIGGLSNSRQDLETLLKLRVTDYHYIDKISKGANGKKGFIAQEVEQVYPEAVSKIINYIPNVYLPAECAEYNEASKTLTVTVSKPHDFAPNDKVRLFTGKKKKEVQVGQVLSPTTFTIKNWEGDHERLFVYGKQVKDFRAVDYERLFTLGVSSVQELSGEVDLLKTDNMQFATENAQLKAKLAEIENKNAQLQSAKADASEMNQLKEQLSNLKFLMEKNGIRSER